MEVAVLVSVGGSVAGRRVLVGTDVAVLALVAVGGGVLVGAGTKSGAKLVYSS